MAAREANNQEEKGGSEFHVFFEKEAALIPGKVKSGRRTPPVPADAARN
jgi:hypothetical protein